MDTRKIDAILAARALLKADKPKDENKPEEDKKPPTGYESWEEFNNAHPRGPDGKFGSGGSSSSESSSTSSSNNSYDYPTDTSNVDTSGNIDDAGTTFKIIRAPQITAFTLDSDPKFSNITSEDGFRMSFTGLVDGEVPAPPSSIGPSMQVGASVGAASGLHAIQSANRALARADIPARVSSGLRTETIARNTAVGLAHGLIAGAINDSIRNSDLKDMVSATNFGERAQATNVTGLTSRDRVLWVEPRAKPREVSPGVYESTYYATPKVLNGKPSPKGDAVYSTPQQRAAITVHHTYRGPAYAEKYPKTDGWETQVVSVKLTKPIATVNPDSGFTGKVPEFAAEVQAALKGGTPKTE